MTFKPTPAVAAFALAILCALPTVRADFGNGETSIHIINKTQRRLTFQVRIITAGGKALTFNDVKSARPGQAATWKLEKRQRIKDLGDALSTRKPRRVFIGVIGRDAADRNYYWGMRDGQVSGLRYVSGDGRKYTTTKSSPSGSGVLSGGTIYTHYRFSLNTN